jgi:hypothetical protein
MHILEFVGVGWGSSSMINTFGSVERLTSFWIHWNHYTYWDEQEHLVIRWCCIILSHSSLLSVL